MQRTFIAIVRSGKLSVSKLVSKSLDIEELIRYGRAKIRDVPITPFHFDQKRIKSFEGRTWY